MLEEELQAPLFDRYGKKLVLTQIGKEIYPFIIELLETYEKIKSVPVAHEKLFGKLKIGASETVTVFRLHPVLAKFKKLYPNVDVILVNDNCPNLRERVLLGELDIAIVLEPEVEDEELVIYKLIEEPLVFISGKESTVNFIGESENERLNQECFIFSEGDCSLRNSYRNYLRKKKIFPKNTLELSSMEAIKQCVASGLGISLMPHVSASKLIDEGLVMRVECEKGLDLHFTQMVYYRKKWISSALQIFIDEVVQHFSIDDA